MRSLAVISVVALFASQVGAQALPPPSWVQSIEITEEGAPIVWGPGEKTKRRGTLKRGTRLAVVGRVFAPGCSKGAWYQTADDLYVCESHAVPSTKEPGGVPQPMVPTGKLLPFDYAFVQVDGTRAFAHPNDYFADQYTEAMGEGFGIVVSGSREYEGIPFVRTRGHLWVERDQVGYARGSRFSGVVFEPGKSKSIAWTKKKHVAVRDAPKGKITKRLGRRDVVTIVEIQEQWLSTEVGWVSARDVARVKIVPPPASVMEGERWIDIDLEEQVLVAYQGKAPVFATLVSTGRERKTHKTPKGEHRIWVKLAFSDMDDIGRTDVSRNYSIQSVPWVQYFKEAVGFHAAFWHNDFGRKRSHGCVNLSPTDARYLFNFTEPALPPGYTALLTTEADRPTLVRVR